MCGRCFGHRNGVLFRILNAELRVLVLFGFVQGSQKFCETRLTPRSPLLLCRPRETGWRLKRKGWKEISKFLLAVIEMLATVAGPSCSGSFENVAQFLQ